MLQELVIHDFAIIKHLSLSFQAGMTALTGETGAGKSIIIDAVGLLAGGRGSADFVRTGAQKATLEGLFVDGTEKTQAVLAAYALEAEDNTVLLQRDIAANGRNVCRVNGHLVNLQTLRAVGETLVDIHGQNEHQQLVHPETHLGLLDQYAGQTVAPLLKAYQTQYQAYMATSAALKKKQANEQEWAQRLDMLQFQVAEIEDAHLQAGEEEALTAERERLANFQKISAALGESLAVLDADTVNPVDQVASAMRTMQGIAALDSAYGEIAGELESAYYGLQDAQSALSREVDDLAFDDDRLDVVTERLALITQLERKYGDTLEAVIAYGQKAAAELDTMQATEAGAADLESRLAKQHQELLQLGAKLRTARKQAAKTLTAATHTQLEALYMSKTVFAVHFNALAAGEVRPDGLDSVEFFLQTNPGEAAKPLAKIASGGELSRIMLALKTIFAKSDGVTAIIFDEVDTGVSGRVAQAIATKIASIAQHSQVLCITHLPQVAAMSNQEYLIEKTVKKGRTATTVTELDSAARIQEIARMLAGEVVTDLAVQHAKELLQLAEATRRSLS